MFCRNCGKEMGDGTVCPNCGNVEQSGVQYGAFGEIRTTDGRGVFKTASEALAAFNKKCISVKIRLVATMCSMLFFFGGFVLWAVNVFILGFGEMPLLGIILNVFVSVLMGFASALFIPAGIAGLITPKTLRKWITENNIDCRATVKNEKSQAADTLMLATYIIENPKKNKRLNVSNVMSLIFFPLFFQVGCGWLIFASYCPQIIYNISQFGHSSFWCAPCFFVGSLVYLALLLAFNLPMIIAGAGLKKKARENFYQNHA